MRALAAAGLVLSTVGVITLFFFSWPSSSPRLPGAVQWGAAADDPDAVDMVRRYKIRAAIGLGLVVVGLGLQVAALYA